MAYAARLTVTKTERAMSLENMFVDGVVLERYQLSELDEELVVEQSCLIYRLTPVFFFIISRNLIPWKCEKDVVISQPSIPSHGKVLISLNDGA